MIRTLATAGVLLTLTACGALPAQSNAHANGKPVPAGPPPPPMPDSPLVCPTDVRLCPDGRTVNRSPASECEFDACPGALPR